MTTETATVERQQSEIDLEGIIRELDEAFDYLPKDALRACQENRELATPRLIETIREAVKLGREGTIREGNAHFFAWFLLAEFQATEALPDVLDLLSLRDPVLEGLLGGAITEGTQRVLATLAGDQPDLIESMIANRELDDYARWTAAEALCVLVRSGRLSRTEAIERLVRQMRAALEAKDRWGTTITVCELGDLNPLEVQDEIKAAFDQRLVDRSIIDWNCFEEYLLKPDWPGECPELSPQRFEVLTDTVAALEGWYCFSEQARKARETRNASPSAAREQGDDAGGPSIQPFPEYEPYYSDIGTVRNETPRVGRNEPCPCGSGKKYKKCCLRAADA